MPLKSFNEIATLVGADRMTIARRVDQLSIPIEDGPRQSKLIDTRKILQLVPPPSKSIQGEGASTFEEARIRETLAKAKKTELEIEKLEGRFADITELMESQNTLFDSISGIIKKSELSDDKKEDILDAMTAATRQWAGME
jgi:hypothetical protein